MIPRFSRPEMDKIWSRENKYDLWREVEMLAVEAQEHIGAIPPGSAAKIRAKAAYDLDRCDEIEKEVRHDVIAFLTNLGENVGEEARYIHLGMTSSDMIDTALSVQMRQAADLLLTGLDKLLAALKKRALEHQDTLCIGRSHGIHAEPTTFGVKLAGHYAAFKRAKERLLFAKDQISTCAISGAVGAFATIDPRVEAFVAEKMGLSVEPVSTQVIPRDRHAFYMSVLAVIATSIENLAVEIRHLQRTEVREVEESFGAGQKGSSAMPHKKNPILSENLTGLARMIRAAATPMLENMVLWHERDISHSAVERVTLPDAHIMLDFAIARLTGVIEGLVVHKDRMRKNIDATRGLIFSQAVMLALTDAGRSREDAYKIVQTHAMKVWEDESADFKALLKADPAVNIDLDNVFDPSRYSKHASMIVARALV